MKASAATLLVFTLLWGGTAVAQVRLAEIAGTVTDDSGAVLPGVSVTTRHVGTQQVRSTTTGANGAFQISGLPAGSYEVRVELAGFRPVIFEDYRLGIGDATRLDVKLVVASLEETLTVVAEMPLIDTTKSTLSGRIDSTQVEELPMSGRNWLDFATLAPGVKGDVGGRPESGVGQARTGSKWFVDGAAVQTFSTTGTQTEISKDVIGEFEVLVNRFDAQLGRSSSVIVNAITKSGTDVLSGNAFFYYRDDALNARDFFTGRVEPYQNRQFGFTLGGPIVRGRTQFFGSYERQAEPTTKSSNTGFAALDVAVDASDTKNMYFGRVDHTLTANHRFNFRVNKYDRNQPFLNTGGSVVPSASTNFNIDTYRYNGSLNSVFGGRFVNQLLFNFTDSEQYFSRTQCGFAPAFGECPTHTFPAARIGPQPNVGYELHKWFLLRNDASYFFEARGSHSLKFGGEFSTGRVIIFFPNATNGVFFYDQNPPNLANCCEGADQSNWDRSQFPVPIRYNVGLGDFLARAPNTIYSLYLQDDWRLNRHLTLNLGVRYDLEIGSKAHDQIGVAVEPSKNDIDNIQPRIGFAWDITGEGRTVVRGGGGLYYDQIWLNLTYNQILQNSGNNINVTTFNTARDPGFANDPLSGRGFEELRSLAGIANVSRIAPDAEQPHAKSYSIGIAHQTRNGLALAADYVHQRSGAMLWTYDSNLFCCTPNGFPLPINSGNYPELGGFYQGVGRPDPRFGAINNYTTLGSAVYNALQIAINKRMTDNYQYGITYTLSKNEDDTGSANNPFDLESEWGRSSQDQRHRFTANWVVRLPYDFNFNGILLVASGQAVNATTGGIDINGDASGAGDRPVCGLDPRFNPGCSFLGIPDGQRVPRYPFTSAGVARLDVRFSKTFRTGGVQLQPLLEVFNVMNRRNYNPASYQTSLANVNYGRPGRSTVTAYLPRQIQLGARVMF